LSASATARTEEAAQTAREDRAIQVADPRAALAELAGSTQPYLIGVRHHSPALAAVVPALLDAAGVDVLCIEMPTDFQSWLPHLSHPQTVAPVALAGAAQDGHLGFYPFADFSPELAALRWARERGVEVLCCDLSLSDPGWSAGDHDEAGERARPDAVASPTFSGALSEAGTGRDGDDLWDRAVEVLAPGCPPEAVRRAALGVGWALRQDAGNGAGVPAVDLAREAQMRHVIGLAGEGGKRRVAAVIGSFHAPAMLVGDGAAEAGTEAQASVDQTPAIIASLVPYAYDLLDSRSGYPAGIRDPLWQQAVFAAGGDGRRPGPAARIARTRPRRTARSRDHCARPG
jgi:Family of unknown function (DUF5682)